MDMDCGKGRYCSMDGICSIDCTTDKDCHFLVRNNGLTENYYCSACGRCLNKEDKDTACIVAKEILCEEDSTCQDQLSNDYFCSDEKLCVKRCSNDTSCKKIGRGWSCGNAGFCIRKCICNKDCYFFGWGYACILPDGVDEKSNCESPTPVYGKCQPREGGIDWGKDINYEKSSFSYTGIWGWNLNYAVRTTGLPLVSQQDSVSIAYGLAKIIQNSKGGITINLKLCSIRLKNFKEDDSEFEDLAYIIVPDSYADSVPIVVNNTDFISNENEEIISDIFLDIRGARLPDPWNTPLPDYENLLYAYDQDRDGKPGMTTFVNGILTGEVYNAQRWWVKYHIKRKDRDHLHGLIDFNSEETILGASNKILLTKIKVMRHPQNDRSYFRAQRLNDAADCNTVLELKDKDDSFIKFTPHFEE